MIVHSLKVKYEYASKIAYELKKFELRKDDRNYQIGDFIKFEVVDIPDFKNCSVHEKADIYRVLDRIESKHYLISYKLDNVPEYGLSPGYCILNIIPIDSDIIHDIAVYINDYGIAIIGRTPITPESNHDPIGPEE